MGTVTKIGAASPGRTRLLIRFLFGHSLAGVNAIEHEIVERYLRIGVRAPAGAARVLLVTGGAGAEPPGPAAGAGVEAITLAAPDLEAALPRLAPLLDDSERVLVWLAPGVLRTASFARLAELVARPAVELLTGLALGELERLSRYRATPVADLPLPVRRPVEALGRLFGEARYEWLARWRTVEAERGAAAAADAIAERFAARLAAALPHAVVRRHPLRPPGAAAAPAALHLLLVSVEPECALLLNRIVHGLRVAGRLAWEEPRGGGVRLEDPGVLELFGETAAAPLRVVDDVALAALLLRRHAGQQTTLREVMRPLAATDLFPADVRRVLRRLRSEGLLHYDSLAGPEVVICFAGSPAPGRRRAGRRRGPPDEPALW